ncbi:MAG: hypothetical protein KAG61_07210 [Bacteriovoracaceae bacterium]|nr:hypothetical protein [Bacteriovoracaceae bacterium]
MIHGNSSDPVYLKKIALNIWTLRDEIEMVAAQKIERDGVAKPDAIELIQKEYTLKSVAPSEEESEDAGEISEEGELDDSEDAMAAALAEAEEGESTEGPAEDSAASEVAEEPLNKNQINVIRPKLPQDKTVVGRTMLAEIYMDKMYFFSDHNFLDGQSIVIEFQIPKNFIVNAQVIYCRNYNLKSRIIKTNKLLFRACVEFSFLKKGERTLLRDFLQSVEPKIEKSQKKAKKKADEDDDDDIFSELDNL